MARAVLSVGLSSVRYRPVSRASARVPSVRLAAQSSRIDQRRRNIHHIGVAVNKELNVVLFHFAHEVIHRSHAKRHDRQGRILTGRRSKTRAIGNK